LHKVADPRLAFNRAHDRAHVRDLDVLTRLEVRLALRKTDWDFDLGKPSNSAAEAVSNR
jgi:hypothetical protein